MIRELTAEECRRLLTAASVGRLGFTRSGQVEIIPVNYVLDGDDLIIRTLPDGLVSSATASGERIAFEVDHLEDLAGEAWSILMHGQLHAITDADEVAALETDRVTPWAGGDRSLHLRFVVQDLTGRWVRRERNT